MKTYHVYIMSSVSRVLYVGVTNDLARRVTEHKAKQHPGFSARYNTYALVYFEPYSDIRAAIAREKQIKGWLRAKKVALIKSTNPKWTDLSSAWTKHPRPGDRHHPCHPEGIRPGCPKDLNVTSQQPRPPRARANHQDNSPA